MENLLSHQQRVVDEYNEKKSKASELSAFILDNPEYLKKSKEEQKDIKEKYDAICICVDELEKQVANFSNETA